MKTWGLLLLSVLLLASPPGARAERPRIALLLGGGGARGGAHIGVLQALEEMRVPVDVIYGTSIGSIIGGLYASGLSPQGMAAELDQLDWDDLLSDLPPRSMRSFRRREEDWFNYFPTEIGIGRRGFQGPSGLRSAHKLEYVLNRLTLRATAVESFDELPIPYRATATDLASGEAVVLDGGSLIRAMRASMSIPGAFTPVELDGRLLVDGSISLNLPVELAIEEGADVIIAVDVSPTIPHEGGSGPSALLVGARSLSILMRQNVRRSTAHLREQDRLFVPPLEGIGLLDFTAMEEARREGREFLLARSSELADLAVDEEEFAAWRQEQRRPPLPEATGIVIDSLVIEAGERVPRHLLDRNVGTRPGAELDLDQIEEDLLRIYRIGEFDRVGFRLDRTGGTNRLHIEANEKPWGPHYLRFGLRIDAVSRGGTDATLLLQHRRSYLNSYGAEWRTRLGLGDRNFLDAEFYQPVLAPGWIFIAPRIALDAHQTDIFPANGPRVVVNERSAAVQLDAGLQAFNRLELRAGVRRGEGRYNSGEPGADVTSRRVGQWIARFTWDSLDRVGFPDRGGYLGAEARFSRTPLGAEANSTRLAARAAISRSVRRLGLTLATELGTDFATDIPAHELFRLGGLFRISGIESGQRTGGALGLASLVARYRTVPLPEALGKDLYVGGSVETGNTWRTAHAARIADLVTGGSVFVSLDTHLGPWTVAWGMAEGGDTAFRVTVGPTISAPFVR